MTDDITKGLQRMEDDDLLPVSGGVSSYHRQSPNTGTHRPIEQTVLNDDTRAAESAVNTGLSDFIGNITADSVKSSGLGKTLAYCPECGTQTLHVVFNGGRGKCTVCGNVKDKV